MDEQSLQISPFEISCQSKFNGRKILIDSMYCASNNPQGEWIDKGCKKDLYSSVF